MVKDKKFYIHLLLLTLPIMFQNIVTYAVSLADNVMVGSLGEIALDGIYVVNQVTTLTQRLMQGITAAMILLAAQYWGKNDIKSVKYIVSIGIQISLFTSIIMAAALFFFPVQVLGLFTNKPEIINAGIVYGKIISCTYIFYCVSNALVAAMRCVETVRIGLFVSSSAFVVNIFFNWALIYGNLGCPALGVVGAGIATMIARIVEFLIIFVYIMFIDKKLYFRINDFFKASKILYIDFVRYGLPVTIGSVSWGINLAVQGAIIGRLDATVMAAFSISNIFFQVITVGAYGSATASSIIIGKTVGQNDVEKVKLYSRTMQVVFLLIGVFTGTAMFFSKGLISVIYPDLTSETIKMAAQFLIVLSFMAVGTSYQMATLTGIVRAGGATNFVLINDLIFVWLIVLPSACISAFVIRTAPWIVVLCLKCDQILKCFVAVIKVNRFKWIKNLTREVI